MASGTTIAFIGLGRMGAAMSSRLLAAGHDVVGSDTSEAALAEFEKSGGRIASSAEAVRAAEIVILMLPDSRVVEQVLAAGAEEGLGRGATLIDMGSSEPASTRAIADRLAAVGVDVIDAPVSGGVSGAIEGRLAILVGGEPVVVERVAPILDILGKPRHVGPVGAGHAVKALNNLLSAVHLWATSEAVAVAERFGLDPAVVIEAVNSSSGRSGSTDNKWPNFILPGTYDSGFGLSLMLKDMRIATGLARTVGLPAQLGEAATEHWARAAASLPPSADHTEIAKVVDEARS